LANSRELTILSTVSRLDRVRVLTACYATAIASAVTIEGALNTSAGAALCAVLVAALVNHYIASVGTETGADGVFLALALVPLAGVLSVVMPASQVIQAAWPLLVVAPLLWALVLTARQLGLGRQALGLTLRWPAVQLGIAILGVPLGWLAYIGLRPDPLDGGATGLAVFALSVLAFAEELLFRGLLQPFLCRLYGGVGIAATAMLSAAVALGTGSPAYGLFAWLVAAGFGLAARRSGSIAGTSVARALMFIGLLIVWPNALG
jgi:membrane protease YdiL (CAAX protease family)